MKLPKETLGWQKLARMTDSQLFDLHRDYKLFLATVELSIAKVRGRFKALTSETMKREIGKRPSRHTKDHEVIIPATPKGSDVVVTDHAMIRYLERKRGLDITALREEIRSNIAAGEQYINGALTIHEDMVYVRRGGGDTITTIMPVGFMDDDDVKLAGELLNRDEKVQGNG
jgi:hypothetical protein